jgi:hypothetical protein
MLLAFKGYAQYPFEKFPVKKYDSVKFKAIGEFDDPDLVNIARYKNYTIRLIRDSTAHLGGKILLYYKGKLIKSATGDFGGVMREADFPLYIEDINSDGIPDFVFKTLNSTGTGLAGADVYYTCFIKKGTTDFRVVKFESFYDQSQKQYQFSKDGNPVIIGQSLAFYKRHAYWIFDLYQCKNDKLINVSKKYNYPIAVPYLNKEIFVPTYKIPKEDLERLAMKQPGFFLDAR